MGKNSGPVDAFEHVTLPRSFNRQVPIPRFRSDNKSRWPPCGIVVRTQALGAPRWFLGPLLVEDLRDPDAVIVEDLLAAGFLNRMVLGIDPPGDHRSLVLPYLVREQQIISIQALEPVDEEAAAHGFEGWFQ